MCIRDRGREAMVRLMVSSPRLASLVNTIPVTFIALSLLLQHVTGLQHGVGFHNSALGRDADLFLFPACISAAHNGVLADLGILAQNGICLLYTSPFDTIAFNCSFSSTLSSITYLMDAMVSLLCFYSLSIPQFFNMILLSVTFY